MSAYFVTDEYILENHSDITAIKNFLYERYKIELLTNRQFFDKIDEIGTENAFCVGMFASGYDDEDFKYDADYIICNFEDDICMSVEEYDLIDCVNDLTDGSIVEDMYLNNEFDLTEFSATELLYLLEKGVDSSEIEDEAFGRAENAGIETGGSEDPYDAAYRILEKLQVEE